MNEPFAACTSSTSNTPLDLDQLVRKCCDCFDGDPVEPESKFPDHFFTCSEWLADLSEIMALFVALVQNDPLDYGQKVCSCCCFWIRHFPAHFDANPQLCRILARLKSVAIATGIARELVEELDISAIQGNYAWLRNPSTRNPVNRNVSLSLCFEQWTADDIATSMSHIDYKVLCRVTVPELKNYVKLGRLAGLPHLERSITVFNSFSGWVQTTILSKQTPQERASVMRKFVEVARNLHAKHNFNTLMAVIGGLKHSNIDRLTRTLALLPPEVSEELERYTQLLSYKNNYSDYRRALREVHQRFRMPIMGVHLKDLIAFWNSANLKSFERTRCISERQLAQLAFLLSHFLSVNRMPTNFGEANLDLINTLKVLFDIRYDEEKLYQMSIKHESSSKGRPSDAGKTATTANKATAEPPAIFADWAKGVCKKPPAESVEKHIAAMVDAVFKHYDRDRRGYISKADFEQFTGNFAFIASSSSSSDEAMTKENKKKNANNQQSQISRAEMQSYFTRLYKLRNNSASGGSIGGVGIGLVGCSPITHQWSDWHFLVPAICAQCSKMLWMRHGTRCTQCSLATHESCRLAVVPECSSSSSSNKPSEEPGPHQEAAASTSSGGTGGGGLTAWLNGSLSPRFTAIGPLGSGGNSKNVATATMANGRHNEQQQKQLLMRNGACTSRPTTIRRVRTSSSSTSESSSGREIQTSREENSSGGNFTRPSLFSGVVGSSSFRQSFRSLFRSLDKTAAKPAGRTSSETTDSSGGDKNKAAADQEEDNNNSDNQQQRVSLASEEVFEEDIVVGVVDDDDDSIVVENG